MTILTRWFFLIPAYALLFIGYMLTAEDSNMSFAEWLNKYAKL